MPLESHQVFASIVDVKLNKEYKFTYDSRIDSPEYILMCMDKVMETNGTNNWLSSLSKHQSDMNLLYRELRSGRIRFVLVMSV
ncbi:Hypothetical protein ORPV_925 [Orpheovirus IHUMI-LCC2]|uniref:Uncharacterized protein n=1 Tax=Orpheovirus IHUMI-LCC2 TaxID=2023057 RepID=A0A2I2L5U9_9VIRU|nr:Hypothetical protein ORPV_925 [Orpheovirus IHUMI-LCC2]SNW62829.1 Hypothetical protein ORPV_925 [Orpheovirus IHUMI-LCC2]